MPNEVDRSLLDRLQALRGGSATPEHASPARINVDLIERKKTPTREDTLAARLKSLRNQDEGASPSPVRASPAATATRSPGAASSPLGNKLQVKQERKVTDDDDEEVEALFQTDDQALEELLGDVGPDEGFTEPDDARVKALLEELSQSMPQDDDSSEKKHDEGNEKDNDSDDSDGEGMTREVDEVIARFRDEIEVEASLTKDQPSSEEDEEEEASLQDPSHPPAPLPDLPPDLTALPSRTTRAPSADINDITARLAALCSPDQDETLAMPSVPTSKPSGKPVNRLTSTTAYTDADADGWCTVCLEDATLRCLGCEGDVYCARCWREMHVGPAAGYEERSHKAVQFTRDRKKVALGA